MEANQIKLTPLLISLVAVFSVETSLKILVSTGNYSSLIILVILGLARVAETFLILFAVLIQGDGLASVGLKPSEMVSGCFKGMIWSAGFGLIAALAGAVLLISGIQPVTLIRSNLPVMKRELALFFVIGGVVGPIAEEVFFRGIIYGFFRRWGILTALVLSTLVFTLSHPFVSGVPVTQVVGGILFAIAYEVEGCLVTPILIHILGNLSIFTLSLLS